MPVMLFLIHDVINQRAFLPEGMRERTITILPMREIREHVTFLDPNRTRHLDVFDEVSEGDGRVQAAENVKVIFDAVEAVRWLCLFLMMPQT